MPVVVYRKPSDVAVEEVPDPRIEHPNDVIVRITSTYIGGSCRTAKGPCPGGQAESLRVPYADGLPLDQAPSAYEKFDQRIEGYTKVILEPEFPFAGLDRHRRLSTTIIDKENRMRRWHR